MQMVGHYNGFKYLQRQTRVVGVDKPLLSPKFTKSPWLTI